jgi:hypothetical protein
VWVFSWVTVPQGKFSFMQNRVVKKLYGGFSFEMLNLPMHFNLELSHVAFTIPCAATIIMCKLIFFSTLKLYFTTPIDLKIHISLL